MPKRIHEVRDPIHVFIRYVSDERDVINSRPLQRLRHIHQLAMSFLVYPGATHRRFEHSLGVMELAGRVYDVITSDPLPRIKDSLEELGDKDKLMYWRRVIRMAALLHDIGHLPFSHAAERELLPQGWDHERLTVELIRSPHIKPILEGGKPPLNTEDVVKLAVGPKRMKGVRFSPWEGILSDIIVGDAFGVDRIDYLLRDSLHAGVAYGKFDHFRLLDTLRILPRPEIGDKEELPEPMLGVEEGGLQSAEALLFARYFMYTQVYFHRVRRAYDIHLKDFLTAWLTNGKFSTELEEHLNLTDNEVTAAFLAAARDPSQAGHEAASRIVGRKHFGVGYEPDPLDLQIYPDAGQAMFNASGSKFGKEKVRRESHTEGSTGPDFPVMRRKGTIVSSHRLSESIRKLPVASFDYVFVAPEILGEYQRWVDKNKRKVLRKTKGEAGT